MPELNLSDLSSGQESKGNNMMEWLKQAKELLPMLQDLKNHSANQAAGKLQGKVGPDAQKTASQVIKVLNELGLGDVPIGDLLERIKPFSINQMTTMGRDFISERTKKLGLGDDARPGK